MEVMCPARCWSVSLCLNVQYDFFFFFQKGQHKVNSLRNVWHSRWALTEGLKKEKKTIEHRIMYHRYTVGDY